jgi:hypothetical protein
MGAVVTRLYRARTGETIEARRFVCSPAIELDILAWANAYRVKIVIEHDSGDQTRLRIPASGGDYIARSGDWIIRDGSGEFRPCAPRVFEVTYKSVH